MYYGSQSMQLGSSDTHNANQSLKISLNHTNTIIPHWLLVEESYW